MALALLQARQKRLLALSALLLTSAAVAYAGSGAPLTLGAPSSWAIGSGSSPSGQVDGPRYAIPTTPDHIGRILARVMINGQGPYRFMVDTGANQTVLSEALALRLNLPIDRTQPVSVNGIAGSTLAATIYVESLDSGPMHLRTLRLPVLATPVLDDIDGILGIDSLANKTMTADFMHDRLTIAGNFGGVPLGDVVLSARLVSEHLLEVDGLIGGIHAKAIIDTGSPRTLGNMALLNALEHRFQLGARSFATGVIDATDALQPGMLQQVPSLQFGTTQIGNLYITFGDFSVFHQWDLSEQPALLVGMDVLGIFAEMSIDYRRKELGLRARSDAYLTR